MKLGIFQVAPNRPELTPKYGLDAVNFMALLKPHDETIDFHIYMTLEGDWPADVDDCDAYLVTGSPHAVYEDHDYIDDLCRFCRTAAKQKPLIGICYGHQLFAHAFGGRVEKSPKGWGVGIERYQFSTGPAWLPPGISSLQTIAMHQDQVVTPPPGAVTIAGNDFCPYGMLQIGENILTLQTHPEMKTEMARDLIKNRIDRIGEERAKRALSSLELPNERALIGSILVTFLKSRHLRTIE